MDDYTEARTTMLEHNLLSNTEPLLVLREIEEFKTKIEGTDVLTWLMEMPDFPTAVTSVDERAFACTLIGRCRQFLKARAKPGTGTGKSEEQVKTMKEKDKNKKEKKVEDKEKAKMSEFLDLVSTPQQSEQQLDFANKEKERQQAARNPNKAKGAGKGKQAVAGSGNCPQCKGTTLNVTPVQTRLLLLMRTSITKKLLQRPRGVVGSNKMERLRHAQESGTRQHTILAS